MREDLQRRIGTAIDSPEGIDGDTELRAALASDPEAAAYARDLQRLGGLLRDWPLPEPSDDAMEALARRIEQRLGDTLPRIADPTQAPQFDDDDDLRDATAGLLGPVVSSGEFELRELESIPPAAAPAPSARPPVPPPGVARPPLAPRLASPLAPPGAAPQPAAAREIPKLVRASDGDRLSFPTPPPAGGVPSLHPVRELPPRRSRGGLGWFAGLAAAAAVGLGVFATTTMYDGESLAPAEQAAAPQPAAMGEPQAAGQAGVATGGALPAQAPALGAADDGMLLAEMPAEAAAAEGESLMAREAVPMAAVPMAAPTSPAAVGAPAVPPPGARYDGMLRGGGGRGAASSGSSSGPIAQAAPDPTERQQDSPEGRAARRRAPTATTTAEPRALPLRIESPSARPRAVAPPRAEAGEGGGGSGAAARGGTASGGASAAAAPTAPRDLPAAPERGAVLSAIQSIEPAVRACAESEHGVATVRIVVAGSGRVTTATVSGQFAGTPVGSCVARAVRGGRFPPFASDRFEVTYPFHL